MSMAYTGRRGCDFCGETNGHAVGCPLLKDPTTATITIHVSRVQDVDALFDEVRKLKLKSARIDDTSTVMDQDEQLVVEAHKIKAEDTPA